MSSPKSIPSKISTSATTYTAGRSPQSKLHITALLLVGDLTVDGVSVSAVGPLNLSSPIICDQFETAVTEQVAYYEA